MKYKILTNGKEVGDILEQQKSNGIFVANVTINKLQILGHKRFSDLMQAPVLSFPEKLISAITKSELDNKVHDFVSLHIQDEFEIVQQ